jgi:predicted phosphoadenosine phosphosulfate sulfurtransferase
MRYIPLRYYLDMDVVEAARRRIRWIFEEFDRVIVSTSGGKDSTVAVHLSLEIAQELGRPLYVFFLDQEIEWDSTIEVVRHQMSLPGVTPLWCQIPFRLSNATSYGEPWLYCWDPAKEGEWMRPKEDIAIKENTFGVERFHELALEVMKQTFPGEKTANIAAVRADESVPRRMALTKRPKYKWVTWGTTIEPGRVYRFFPFYDWSVADVWKLILQRGWKYNRIYDRFFQYGVPLHQMRVSNIHHELSIWSLFIAHEVEPEVYSRAIKRLGGLHSAVQLSRRDFFPDELPYMFGSWKEYRDYLLEHLIIDPARQEAMRKWFASDEKSWSKLGDFVYKAHIGAILLNDYEGVKRQSLPSATYGETKGRERCEYR